jgi:penicillin-insensitive murein endopeptidase
MRLGRNRRYGHPMLVAFVQRLGLAARHEKLGVVLVGDLSQPRGGPTPSGHRSHQTGLDADIGYAAPAGTRAGHLSRKVREQISPLAVVDLKTHERLPAWTPAVAQLLELAATDPAVDRIFVNPAVKKMLCEGKDAKAPWQGRLRPWYAHHDHFHVRLKCPPDSPKCEPQAPPPNDGCGPSLAWWFSDDAESRRTKKKEAEEKEPPPPPPQMPPTCVEVLQAK